MSAQLGDAPASLDGAVTPARGEFATTMAGLVRFASTGSGATPDLAELLTLAVAALPAARHACLTIVGPNEKLRTVAATDDAARELDQIQHRLGEGPGMDDVSSVDLIGFADLAGGGAWPAFTAQARERGVHSLLSVRVPVPPLGVAALSFYGEKVSAFDDADNEIATVCGSFLALLLRGARDRERAENLEIALESNRHIGTAIGVLMARDLLTADAAFERLREASQRLHRKLRDIADDVVATGQMPG